jgi:hypothetical protein
VVFFISLLFSLCCNKSEETPGYSLQLNEIRHYAQFSIMGNFGDTKDKKAQAETDLGN